MNILLFAGTYDHKLISKLSPITSIEKVETIYLVRNSPLRFDKIHSFCPPVVFNFLGMRELYKFFKGIYLCRTKKIDYICGIYFRPHGFFAYIIGSLFQIPVIQVFIGNDVDFVVKHRRLFKGTLRKAHMIGVRGQVSKNRLKEFIEEDARFFIHHNVYPLDMQKKTSAEKKDIDVLCIAAFAKYKRVDVFLKTILEIKKVYPSVRAVMLGGGGMRPYYERMRKRMGLNDSVVFEGRVKDVFPYLSRSRVFLLTSEGEGLPMAMIEAMSAGVPCVVPDVGDTTDIAQDGKNSYVIRSRDSRDFSARIVSLLKNPDDRERIAEEAFKTLRQRKEVFSLSYNQKVWDEILS